MALRASLMPGKAADCHMLLRMIGEIKVSCGWLLCNKGVLGNGHLPDSPM